LILCGNALLKKTITTTTTGYRESVVGVETRLLAAQFGVRILAGKALLYSAEVHLTNLLSSEDWRLFSCG
jgi:hypothetical protein